MDPDRTVVSVVMAGGSGTRLYPASRGDRPKQFLSFGDDDRSLLVRTVGRADFADHRVVLTGPDHADRVRDHLHAADDGETTDVWVEPASRDTGPALLYAAARARAAFEDPVLCCLPSDHHVAGDFASVARRAVAVATETGGLVCVGVEPDRPATGYGYVRPGRTADGYAPVRSFVEKPDETRARELREAGALWNAGVFAWTPTALLAAARETPLSSLADTLAGGVADDGEGAETVAAAFERAPAVSVDRAVMERTDHAFVVPARGLEWDDLGTWDALARVLPADDAGTVTVGDGESLTVDATDSVVASDGDYHVTAVGVEGLVVAAWDDRVLVVPRDDADRVREAVERLRETDAF